MSNPDMLGPSSLAITQAVSAFTTFLPALTDVHKADPNDDSFRATVRMGEGAATALTIGVGAIVSNLTGSPLPTIIGALVCVGLILVYESALNSRRVVNA